MNTKMLFVIVLSIIVVKIRGDCIYPDWKKTCQKYCMDNQLSEIQFNQCYGNHFKCQCNGKDLTSQIESNFQTTVTTSTLVTTVVSEKNETDSCLVNSTCTNGQTTCLTKYSFCQCENEKWISKICPVGNVCKKDGVNSSCRTVGIEEQRSSILSSAMPINVHYACNMFLVSTCFLVSFISVLVWNWWSLRQFSFSNKIH